MHVNFRMANGRDIGPEMLIYYPHVAGLGHYDCPVDIYRIRYPNNPTSGAKAANHNECGFCPWTIYALSFTFYTLNLWTSTLSAFILATEWAVITLQRYDLDRKN